ncbi:MAG: YeeE/YedE family protein [Deltaproteobacteria bacterium]|nr:YeeE/YedE family protein [Deltaproteobacteria bacterium]
MKKNLVAFLCGAVFTIGLGVAGMTDPAKVHDFLDVTGRFDPSLAAVMAAAVGVGLLSFRLVLRRARPVLADRFELPTEKRLDRRLILGSVLFGAGWGLSGYCPGPALASVVTLAPGALVFVTAMLAGMAGYALFSRAQAAVAARASDDDERESTSTVPS